MELDKLEGLLGDGDMVGLTHQPSRACTVARHYCPVEPILSKAKLESCITNNAKHRDTKLMYWLPLAVMTLTEPQTPIRTEGIPVIGFPKPLITTKNSNHTSL